MSGANRRYILAFVYIALAALVSTISHALFPDAAGAGIIELWVAFMVLHIFVERRDD